MLHRRPVQVTMAAVVAALAFGISQIVSAGATPAPGPAPAQEIDPDLAEAGAQVYADNCASCHQSGGIGVVGSFPPLVGNPRAADPEYVAGVVRDGLNETIEVDGVVYTTPMAAIDLSDADREAVAAYVATLASSDVVAPPPAEAVEVGPGDPAVGRDLFVGADRFENGGAACSGCHTAGSVGSLGGPGLGPDLTESVVRLGGEPGLTAWLGDPASPTMRPLFDDRPLTDQETADVVAFLAEAPDQKKASYAGDVLLWVGALGALILLAGMAVAGRGRRRSYVEKLESRGTAR